MTFNCRQFTHVNYAPGSGGNFLISSLFLFDRIAHWDCDVQHGRFDHAAWLDSVWASSGDRWVFQEPWMPWNITCYSRRMPAGNNLTESEYNDFIQHHASEYFHECWKNDLVIVERFNKGVRSKFLDQACWIDIIVTDECINTYKFLVSSKLWIWKNDQQVVISQLDHPDWLAQKYSPQSVEYQKRMRFANQYEFAGYENFDDFFVRYLQHQSFIAPYLTQQPIHTDAICLSLSELVAFDRLSLKLTEIEDLFGQRLDRNVLKHQHNLWCQRSRLIQS
jgi:hypothetical protein